MANSTKDKKNKPIGKRESIFDKEKINKLNSKKALQTAKNQELEKIKTHKWIVSIDGKTKKLVKI